MLTFDMILHLIDVTLTAWVAAHLFLYVVRYWELWGEASAMFVRADSEFAADAVELDEKIEKILRPCRVQWFAIQFLIAALAWFTAAPYFAVVMAVATCIRIVLRAPRFYFAKELRFRCFGAVFYS